MPETQRTYTGPERRESREPAGFKCPTCHSQRSAVTDKRTIAEGTVIRRRRECRDCGARFTSYERIDAALTTTGSSVRSA